MSYQNDTSDLHVTVLGTGTSQGIPVIGCSCAVCKSTNSCDRRLRTSVMIQRGDVSLLVDAGPDLRQQMLTAGLSKISAILLTHEHNDHISGLDDVRPVNFMQRTEIPVYALPRVLDALRRRFDYVFDKSYAYPGLPRITLNEIQEGPAEIFGVPVQVISVMHGTLPVLGFRFGDFCYITDAKRIPDDQLRHLENLDVLILNALHRKEHFSHYNLKEALEVIDKIGPRKAYLTHLSHDMGLHSEVEGILPPGVHLAYDGLKITLRT